MSGISAARQKMVDGQVRPSDVTDIRIIDAMLAVPREAFVPENKRALAYLDLDLDVSEAGSAKRFLIKPVVLAKMLQIYTNFSQVAASPNAAAALLGAAGTAAYRAERNAESIDGLPGL